MKITRRFALTTRVSLAIVLTGLLPAIAIGLLALRTASHMAEDVGVSCQLIAANIADKIDRNLFERYGDVQAFGANEAVNDRPSWYQVGSEKNKIAAATNRYASLYGFYLLSYVVDLEGRVVAVNDRDPAGKPLDTAWLYGKNFKGAEWFQAVLAGRFMKSDALDGTYLEDLHIDEDVKQAYGNDGLVLGFSAPVKDAAGRTIGVWHNCANFSLVEEIVAAAYQHFKSIDCPDAELTLLDHRGRVIVDYDPATSGTESVRHDLNILLKFNLAEQGLKSAKDLVAGVEGHGRYVHARKHVAQVNGYAATRGSLGFPSFKWGVLVRVPESQALAIMKTQIWHIVFILAVSVMGLIGVGLWLGRSISRPLVEGIITMHQIGEQVSAAAGQVAASSQSLAEGASEQAASLEETSASLEELSSMTKRNADSSQQARSAAATARDSADAGAGQMEAMQNAMQTIKSASEDITKILKTIDEIAFQTNILALNAAVEAARAGEHGAGFAVVAEEVRALAQRSAQAAKETATKIEHSVAQSEQGVLISAEVAKSFTDIRTRILQLETLVGEIATASTEQSQGIGQVTQAVTQMDQVTQANAGNAEETAAAAEELNSQSQMLKEAVGQLQTLTGMKTVATAVDSTSTARPPAGGLPATHPKAALAHRADSFQGA